MSYKILAFDGGGIRGIYPAYLLAKGKREGIVTTIKKQVNMLVGTSTGAIIAAALACGVDEELIYQLYSIKSELIFKQNEVSKFSMGLINPKYSKRYLRQLLGEMLGGLRMNQLDCELLITATNVSTGRAIIFDNKSNVRVLDAVLASISAPYFFSFEKLGRDYLADGGLWASNPAFVGYVEAKYKHGIDEDKIKVLSMGTAKVSNPSFLSSDKLNLVDINDLINLLLYLQQNHLDSLCDIMMPNYYKINMLVDEISFDTISDDFTKSMELSYEENRDIINYFLNYA